MDETKPLTEGHTQALRALARSFDLLGGDRSAIHAALARLEHLEAEVARDGRKAEPRELLCMRCGREHPCWFADNDLWNPVLRRPDGSDEIPFLCPTCFMVFAVERGVETMFRVTRGWPLGDGQYGGELLYRLEQDAREGGGREAGERCCEGIRRGVHHSLLCPATRRTPPPSAEREAGERRPVFNDGRCPNCDSIDTRGRTDDGVNYESRCEDCGARWKWSDPAPPPSAEREAGEQKPYVWACREKYGDLKGLLSFLPTMDVVEAMRREGQDPFPLYRHPAPTPSAETQGAEGLRRAKDAIERIVPLYRATLSGRPAINVDEAFAECEHALKAINTLLDAERAEPGS